MSDVIAAEPRTEFGKGFARRVRRAAKVPAVLHAPGADPVHLSIAAHELALALKHDPKGVITLATPTGELKVLAKIVVKDPIKGTLEHVDLVPAP